MKNIISLFDRINVRTIDGMNTTYSILDFCLEEVENQGSNSFLSFFLSFFLFFSFFNKLYYRSIYFSLYKNRGLFYNKNLVFAEFPAPLPLGDSDIPNPNFKLWFDLLCFFFFLFFSFFLFCTVLLCYNQTN